MAKRYHHSESHTKRHSEHHGKLPHRKDGHTLSEAHGDVANLPGEIKYHAWGLMPASYMNEHPNDNMEGIDRQIEEGGSKIRSHRSPRKA